MKYVVLAVAILLAMMLIALIIYRAFSTGIYDLTDLYIHRHTNEPKYYVEVKDPPKTRKQRLKRMKDARQIQFNRKSKFHKYYSGSYLPRNDKKLIKQGWENTTSPKNTTGNRDFYCPTTGQNVKHEYNVSARRLDKELYGRHYHWLTCWTKDKKNWSNPKFYDKYGNPCKDKDTPNSPHHIGEEGKPYVPVKSSRTGKKQGSH